MIHHCCKCRKKIEAGTECWDRADGKGKRRIPLCVPCDKDAAEGFKRGRAANSWIAGKATKRNARRAYGVGQIGEQ